MSDAHPKLRYFADPMCSWCWGFSPVIAAVADAWRGRLALELVVGGLRAGNRRPTDAAFRAEILGHWRAVQARTGQAFTYDGALPDGFVYDTEPACRAAVTIAGLRPEATLDFFHAVQRAFYVEGRDITRADTLAALVAPFGVEAAAFRAAFDSHALRAATREHFERTRAAGVRGFPTLLGVDARGVELLTHGYRPFEELRAMVDGWYRQRVSSSEFDRKRP